MVSGLTFWAHSNVDNFLLRALIETEYRNVIALDRMVNIEERFVYVLLWCLKPLHNNIQNIHSVSGHNTAAQYLEPPTPYLNVQTLRAESGIVDGVWHKQTKVPCECTFQGVWLNALLVLLFVSLSWQQSPSRLQFIVTLSLWLVSISTPSFHMISNSCSECYLFLFLLSQL